MSTQSVDIDNSFISCLYTLEEKRLPQILSTTGVDLIKGSEKNVYEFISGYFGKAIRLPSKNAVLKKFPDFSFSDPEDDIIFYIEEINNRRVYDVVTKGLSKLSSVVYDGSIKDVRGIVADIEMQLNNVISADIESAVTNFDKRLEDYKEAKTNKGVIGMITGIPPFDENLGGIIDEYFIIMGKSGVGKTWMSLIMMKTLWRQVEAPIVFVTNEISPDKIFKRFDSLEAEIPYANYRIGKLTEEQEHRLTALKDVYRKRHPIYVINGAGKSVYDIEAEIAPYEPAILFVDGIYLTNMGYNDIFENTLQASRAYQRLHAKYHIPVIATTQMTNDSEVKYARAIFEDSDIVMKIFRDPTLEADNLMGMQFKKVREGANNFRAFMNWNFEEFDFSASHIDSAEVTSDEDN